MTAIFGPAIYRIWPDLTESDHIYWIWPTEVISKKSYIGMYVNHEFTIAVITVIFGNCRDFMSQPWLSPNMYNFDFQTVNFVLIFVAHFLYLGAYSRIIKPSSLPGSSTCIYRTMASHTAAQSQTDTAGVISCDHKHTADRAGKSVHSMGWGQLRKHRYCRRVGGFRSERQRCGSIAPT